MLPELGHFSLIIALCITLLLTLIPSLGVSFRQARWMALARPLAWGQFVFVALAFGFLVQAFLADDFSVRIVATNSNTALPDLYKVTAVWGGHEGSMLLWIFILSAWTSAVALFSRQLPLDMVARVLAVMGVIGIGFMLFSLLTSNPFERLLPQVPMEGKDLNPLLQDMAMAIHPPMLYFGYVGFSVAFAFAIAALWSGRLDAAWARWSRPWTDIAWVFLTFGIALGSWWAYYELGWGGWWFWDPVENASFMPWLVGTALIHSLAVTEKRGVFKSWTVLLAIFAFSLSLLGTFLVRSGVLTSVHSFAADPERGVFILGFLGVIIGGSLTLYALRAPTVLSTVGFGAWSRELFLLVNNVLLLVAAITVLFGTLFPLLADALDLGKYSVGPPYFNAVFVPLMAILLAVMSPGIHSSWKKSNVSILKQRLLVAFFASLAVGILFPFVYAGEFNVSVVLAVMLAAWLVLGTASDIRHKLRNAASLSAGLSRLPASYFGMTVAHLGLAVCVLGVCLTTNYDAESDVRLAPNETVDVAGYSFTFLSSRPINGPNYQADQGTIKVSQNGKEIATLLPEKRRYRSQMGNVMTEAAIDAGVFRDLYVAMGEKFADGAWAVRIHYKPFVRWIWFGAFLMGVGGIIAVADKRYRLAKTRAAAYHGNRLVNS